MGGHPLTSKDCEAFDNCINKSGLVDLVLRGVNLHGNGIILKKDLTEY